MKFNNENAKEQMTYVAPKAKLINVRPQSIICGSLDGLNDIEGDDVQDNTSRWGY